MGKAGRKKREAELRLEQRKQAEEQARQLRNRRTKKIVALTIAVIMALTAIIAPTAMFITARLNNGTRMRNTIVLESENFHINGAMLTYHFYDNIHATLAGPQGELFIELGLAFGINLRRTRPLTMPETTWFKYFFNEAYSNAQALLVFAEAALEANLPLNEHNRNNIEATISDLQRSAHVRNMSLNAFLSRYFGRGVQEGDVRDFLELLELASNKSDYIRINVNITDEEILNHYEVRQSEYWMVDYLSIVLGVRMFDVLPIFGELTEQQRAVLWANRQRIAAHLAEAATRYRFETVALDYFRALYEEAGEQFTSEDQVSLLQMITVLSHQLSRIANIPDPDGRNEWLFSDEREAGDTITFESPDHGTIAILFILNPLHRDERITKNIREIFFDLLDFETPEAAEDAARRVWNMVNGRDDLTEEMFIAFAQENFTDPVRSALGGIINNLILFDADDPGAAVINWAHENRREHGDISFIESALGYHIVFYIGEGLPVWKADIVAYLEGDYIFRTSLALNQRHPIIENNESAARSRIPRWGR